MAATAVAMMASMVDGRFITAATTMGSMAGVRFTTVVIMVSVVGGRFTTAA
jgi:hypothetical protein